MVLRAKTVIPYLFEILHRVTVWLFTSKETTNFTYELERDNKCYLASVVADILNIEYNTAMVYIKEIEEDEELKNHILNMTSKSELSFIADKEVRFGRRIGWYIFARALKPKVIIETGVEKGLGACVLTAALKWNKTEGFIGEYFGTDINPNAGYLLSGIYSDYGKILYGDSIQSLLKFNDSIDLFINDSDHSSSYEAKEYEIIANKLTDKAVILGDNSHCTDELFKFSIKTNRHFIYFQEKPLKHWYPGAGIGISFTR